MALARCVGFDPLGDFAEQPIDRAVAGAGGAVGVAAGRFVDYLESASGDHFPVLALNQLRAKGESHPAGIVDC